MELAQKVTWLPSSFLPTSLTILNAPLSRRTTAASMSGQPQASSQPQGPPSPAAAGGPSTAAPAASAASRLLLGLPADLLDAVLRLCSARDRCSCRGGNAARRRCRLCVLPAAAWLVIALDVSASTAQHPCAPCPQTCRVRLCCTSKPLAAAVQASDGGRPWRKLTFQAQNTGRRSLSQHLLWFGAWLIPRRHGVQVGWPGSLCSAWTAWASCAGPGMGH